MAAGRTVSAKSLTEFDRGWLGIAERLSKNLENLILEENKRKKFHSEWSKISLTRDAGRGVGGGKLQRDALCTRGRHDKAPFSNRNLRWHPLIIADNTPDWAIEVQGIEVRADKIYFIIDNKDYSAEEVYKLESGQPLSSYLGETLMRTNKPYCAPLTLWRNHVDTLREWNDAEWTKNSCAISAMEFSPAEYCIEIFALLAIAVLYNFYGVDYSIAVETVLKVFSANDYNPTCQFYDALKSIDDILRCPLCKAKLNEPPAGITPRVRPPAFQRPWQPSKRAEGEPESIQLFHIEPLTETEIRHTPKSTRYGHRWCNVAMADRSLEETLDFMEAVVRVHRGSVASISNKNSSVQT